jgi:Secretion system C-terminal sorting domain/Kelch motif
MKKLLGMLLFVLIVVSLVPAQQIPNLPIPLCAGSAEVWRDTIYYVGGSNNWSGSIVYPRIYKFDGNSWTYHDSIPDYNLWDVETILIGNDVYLISGWPSGPYLLRKYNLVTNDWTYLASSANTQTWGVAAEYLNGFIYLFNSYGYSWAYEISSDTWTDRAMNLATGSWDLSSILYQNEIYIIGWDTLAFYKYTPATDQWTVLANSPYQVGACAMGVINDSIFCVGGNVNGATTAYYKSVIVYDIPSNTWSVDSARISSRRHWMATADYKGGLYVLGGIDSLSYAVDIVEEVVPQGTSVGLEEENNILPVDFIVSQNYPNPFNPSTTIYFQLPQRVWLTLKIFDPLGKEVETLVEEQLPAGNFEKVWQPQNLPSGIYFYQLKAGKFQTIKKMILMK